MMFLLHSNFIKIILALTNVNDLMIIR